MNKVSLFSVLILLLPPLHAMDSGGGTPALHYGDLPREMDEEVMKYVPQHPVSIALKDGVRGIAQYKHKSLLRFFSSSNAKLTAIWDQPLSMEQRWTWTLESPNKRYAALIGPMFRYWLDWTYVAIAGPMGFLAEYNHSDHVRSMAWSQDSLQLAVRGYDNSVKVLSLAPLLLACYRREHPTLTQFLLVKRLQHSLLVDKPLLIGQTDRSALEETPDLKALLKVEKSKSKTEHPIWRLSLPGKAIQNS